MFLCLTVWPHICPFQVINRAKANRLERGDRPVDPDVSDELADVNMNSDEDSVPVPAPTRGRGRGSRARGGRGRGRGDTFILSTSTE